MKAIERAVCLSDFFQPKEHGKIKGDCVVCARKTDHGLDVDFSDNFMSWNLLFEGNCICPNCYELTRNQDYRRTSWVASRNGVEFLRRDEILRFLQRPPRPPFAIYITKTGKKQGFLKLVMKVALTKKNYFVAFDDNLIYVDGGLKGMIRLARGAIKLGFYKRELLNGPNVRHWKHRQLCDQITHNLKNQLWGLVVYAA